MKRYITGILIAGVIVHGQLIAMNVDGQLDDSFGTNGLVNFDFGEMRNDEISALVIRHDGRIVAGGSCNGVGGQEPQGFGLAILDSDGSSVCLSCTDDDQPGVANFISGLAVQPDNKVVAAGFAGAVPNNSFIVMRYNKDCSLDTSFGTNGRVEVTFPGSSSAGARAVALKRDGRIVVVGQSNDDLGAGPFYAVAVLNQDGSLDNSFAGGAGRRVYNNLVGNSSSEARAVAIQSIGDDDNIVFAGFGMQNSVDRFQVVRLTCNGDVDLTFGTNMDGVETIVFNDTVVSEVAYGVDVKPDGGIAAVGTSRITNSPLAQQVIVAQLNANGTPNTSFGGNDGKVFFPAVTPTDNQYFGSSINVQNDQKLLIGGYTDISNAPLLNFLLVRLASDGSLDTTFNPPNGFLETNFGVGVNSFANAIALQCDGKIVLGGAINTSPMFDFALARYLNENGNDEVIVEPTITQPTNLGNCNTPQPTFSGAAQNPANVTVYIDGQEAGRTITQGSDNTWQFTPPAPLSTGSHTVQMVAEYKSGNQNCITDPLCCGVCLGCQSCLSEAIRPKYCPSCTDFPLS